MISKSDYKDSCFFDAGIILTSVILILHFVSMNCLFFNNSYVFCYIVIIVLFQTRYFKMSTSFFTEQGILRQMWIGVSVDPDKIYKTLPGDLNLSLH